MFASNLWGCGIAQCLLATANSRMRIHFYIIEGEFREDWDDLGRLETLANFVAERLKLIERITGSNNVDIKTIDWDSLIDILDSKTTSLIVPFEKHIRKRLGVYHHYARLLNMLFNRQKSVSPDNFLLSASDFQEDIDLQPLPAKPAVSIGCRYNKNWSSERNLSDSEFVKIIPKLISRFPGYDVMVVSCADGCAHFRSLADINSFNVSL